MTEQADEIRVLVVADVWCRIDGLCAEVRGQLDRGTGEVLVLAPALAGRLHTMTSDLDTEFHVAQQRLDAVLERLDEHGVTARGEVGDANPVIAIDDVLARFPAERILVVTETAGHENWRERGLTERLHKHGLAVHHLTVEHDNVL